MSFDQDIAVNPIEAGLYRCEISPDHWVVAGPNGGYLAAILVRAAEVQLSDGTRQLRSLTVHYLRPPSVGSARIEVTVEQLGRSVAYLRLKLTQKDKPVLLATGAWARRREGFEFDAWTPPEAARPEDCPGLTSVRGGPTLPVHQQWEIRSATQARFGGGQAPDLTWWIRPAIHRPLDGPMIVAISDALPPPIFVTEIGPMAIPTIDLTVHVRTQLSDVQWEPGDWLLARFTTRRASGGFLEEDGEVWTKNGHLIAHSRQLALGK
jgi:acyl-CoA thioesterase